MATPHIMAKKGDFAKTVLMPGDPLRARFIAENFLENAVLVNDVRGIYGYTGYYKMLPPIFYKRVQGDIDSNLVRFKDANVMFKILNLIYDSIT